MPERFSWRTVTISPMSTWTPVQSFLSLRITTDERRAKNGTKERLMRASSQLRRNMSMQVATTSSTMSAERTSPMLM